VATELVRDLGYFLAATVGVSVVGGREQFLGCEACIAPSGSGAQVEQVGHVDGAGDEHPRHEVVDEELTLGLVDVDGVHQVAVGLEDH